MFYHVEFESSIASHRATLVFVEIWIIRDLQIFSNYSMGEYDPQNCLITARRVLTWEIHLIQIMIN